LVQLSVDLNAKQDNGKGDRYYREDNVTAMHLLAVAEHWWNPLALDYLLTVGADPELTTSQGKTVLQVAIRGKLDEHTQPGFWRQEAIAVLLKHKARVHLLTLSMKEKTLSKQSSLMGLTSRLGTSHQSATLSLASTLRWWKL